MSLGLSNHVTDDAAKMSVQVSVPSAIAGWDRVLMMHCALRNDIDGLTVIAKIPRENLARSSPDSCLPPHSSNEVLRREADERDATSVVCPIV